MDVISFVCVRAHVFVLHVVLRMCLYTQIFTRNHLHSSF